MTATTTQIGNSEQQKVLASLELDADFTAKAWKDRIYINFFLANPTFRGDNTNKIWIRHDGLLIWEFGGGTQSAGFKASLEMILNKVESLGLRFLKR